MVPKISDGSQAIDGTTIFILKPSKLGQTKDAKESGDYHLLIIGPTGLVT